MAKKKSKKSKGTKSQVSLVSTEAQNASKTLFANIRFLSVDKPIRTIALTSSVPNEGKTTVSIYLANAIATAGHRILLVECDMRRRSIGRTLGVQSQSGLYSVLTGASTLTASVVNVPLGTATTLDFLDVEPGIPNPPDILASNRFKAFLEEAKNYYDYLVFDTPPIGAFVDGAVLSAVVDATILVFRPGQVKREMLQGAYDQLLKSGGNVIGAVANFVEESKSEYYYAYYYEDGRRSSKSDNRDFQPLQTPRMPDNPQQPALSAQANLQSNGNTSAFANAAVPQNPPASRLSQVDSAPNRMPNDAQAFPAHDISQKTSYPPSNETLQEAQAYSRSAYSNSGAKRKRGHSAHGDYSAYNHSKR